MRLSDWPSLRLVIPLIAGIIISDTIENTRTQVPVWCVFAVIGLFTILILICADRKPSLSGLFLSVSFFLAGVVSYHSRIQQVRVDWPDRYALYRGMITSYPLERERSYRLDVTLLDTLYGGHNIYLYVVKDSAVQVLEPGQIIEFEGKINKPSSHGAGFDYESYLLSHGISGTLRVRTKDWRIVPVRSVGNIRTRAVRFRRSVIRKYREWGLEGNALAVVSAVSLGEKKALSDQLREVYSTSGVSHVLAVSGLHVGIICWMLYVLLPAFLFRKLEWLRELLVMSVLWIYAIAIGTPVSITRTLIMFSIVAVCRAVNRESSALNSLGVAALLLLAVNPSILFDMSFQLSFSAVFFIVILTPFFLEIFEPANPIGLYLWRVSSLSLAAQIGTVPIVMFHFSGFSTYVLLANLFVVPAMFVTVLLSMLLWVAGWWPFSRDLIVKVLTWIIDVQTDLLTRVSALPYSHVELSLYHGRNIFVIYAVVILVYLWYREKRTHRLVQALACIAAGGILDIIQNFVV